MRGKGSIFLRARSPFWWLSYYHNGKKIRESTGLAATEANRKAAEKQLRNRLEEMIGERRGGQPFIEPAQARLKIAALLDDLESDYRARKKCTPQFLSHAKRIRATFGHWRALDLANDAGALDRYINDCQENGIAPATINRGTQVLAQAYKLAIERRQLRFAPPIRRLPERNVRHGYFEEGDFDAVVERLPEYLQDFARFGYETGWRKGEIASLLWADVDGAVIRLRAERSKNRHGRTVPLFDSDGNASRVGTIIERRRAARTITTEAGAQLSGFVFHRAGVPIGDTRKAWASACRAAGMDERLFHDLRRTAVRNMVRRGVPERVAMEISGHRTRSIFDRYNIVDERDKQNALRAPQQAAPKKRKVAVMEKAAGR